MDELAALAEQKGAAFWKAAAALNRARQTALFGKGEVQDTVQKLTAAVTAYRSTGSKLHLPGVVAQLGKGHAQLRHFDEAWRYLREALTIIEATNERSWEAEVNRIAGEVAVIEPDVAKAEACFERALSVSRQQQAKSWELRAAMSLARLWRDQGKVQQACELLAPVYGWFTEGFDTLDLKEAKALLEELS